MNENHYDPILWASKHNLMLSNKNQRAGLKTKGERGGRRRNGVLKCDAIQKKRWDSGKYKEKGNTGGDMGGVGVECRVIYLL